MLDFSTLETVELEARERRAYIDGNVDLAAALAEVVSLRERLKALDDVETLKQWERKNGPANEYKQFFEGCFEHLAGHYPAPSVTSDYDKSVIFDAIAKGTAE
jgi:hypothetical protein